MIKTMNTVLVFFMLLGLISACSGLKHILPDPKHNSIETIELIATKNVNQSTAVAVDIIFVFDEALAGQLSKYTPRNWFNEKGLFEHQYAAKFVAFNYELVPVSHVKLSLKDERKRFKFSHRKAFKVIVFADYLEDSLYYSADITSHNNPVITLEQKKLTIVDGNKS